MKRNRIKLLFTILLLMCSVNAFSQSGERAKSKENNTPNKSLEAPQPKNAEAILQEKIEDTLTEAEEWKEQTYELEKFKVLFPRRSVKEVESVFDESLGKVNVITHLSLGDTVSSRLEHFQSHTP